MIRAHQRLRRVVCILGRTWRRLLGKAATKKGKGVANYWREARKGVLEKGRGRSFWTEPLPPAPASKKRDTLVLGSREQAVEINCKARDRRASLLAGDA